jgi:NTP pyrophosphatase (non-canonical NTP hydrolase)
MTCKFSQIKVGERFIIDNIIYTKIDDYHASSHVWKSVLVAPYQVVHTKNEPSKEDNKIMDKLIFKETLRHAALQDIINERKSQIEKWGDQNHGDLKWLSILVEEIGEVAKVVTEDCPAGVRVMSHEKCQENLEEELIQIAAVCVAWIECIRNTNCRKEDRL